uniref:Uncharacterized protein AlNc14C2G306 n=1 Tax=Albugo laibachii Nc14 TaxID=890382 RepID=F0VZG8_9STRA|nr:conserved hypothetical protein [Albugo laibachii Nc14]|eukprot:CCA14198.1 conserved hypothetical protein [Albugo laibachii Nc14]
MVGICKTGSTSTYTTRMTLAKALLVCSLMLTEITPTMIGQDQVHSFEMDTKFEQQEPTLHTIHHKDSHYISIHFEKFQLRDGDAVIVRSPDNSSSHVYTGLGRSDFGLHADGFYSSMIRGNSAIVEYVPSTQTTPLTSMLDVTVNKTDENTTSYGFKIDKYAFSRGHATTSSVCGIDNSQPARCFQNDPVWGMLYTQSLPVARLFINGKKACTGWLVGTSNQLMTNEHCINSVYEAGNVDVEFGAESMSCQDECQVAGGCRGLLIASTTILLTTNKYYDFTLVQLDPSLDLSAFGHYKMRISGPLVGENVFIPQHPHGYSKRIAITDDYNQLTKIAAIEQKTSCGERRVVYNIDTAIGASGSPVLSVYDGQVVALHNCGTANKMVCDNSGVDIRAVITILEEQNLLPPGAVVYSYQNHAPYGGMYRW